VGLAAAVPVLPLGAALCLGLFGLFLLQCLWGRRGFVRRFLEERYGPLVLTVALALGYVSSIIHGLLLTAAFALAAGILALEMRGKLTGLVRRAERLLPQQLFRGRGFFRPPFTPVNIRPASLLSSVTRGTLRAAAVPGGAILVLAALFFLQPDPHFFAFEAKTPLSFPAPFGYTGTMGFSLAAYHALTAPRNAPGEDALPDLGGYLQWLWEGLAFPYQSLHHPAAGEERVVIPSYRRNGGRIEAGETVVYQLDDAFIARAFYALESPPEQGGGAGGAAANAPYPRMLPLEALLFAQGGFVTLGYVGVGGDAGAGGPRGGILFWAMLVGAALAPALAAALALLMRYRRGRQNLPRRATKRLGVGVNVSMRTGTVGVKRI
jgi:hypothetical protein